MKRRYILLLLLFRQCSTRFADNFYCNSGYGLYRFASCGYESTCACAPPRISVIEEKNGSLYLIFVVTR
jgi:hypothetical protein